MREPLLCRLGFHKWRNFGNIVEISWREPDAVNVRSRQAIGTEREPRDGEIGSYTQAELRSRYATHSKSVYEGQKCIRCGLKLWRELVHNSDGTVSSVGWTNAPHTKIRVSDSRSHN